MTSLHTRKNTFFSFSHLYRSGLQVAVFLSLGGDTKGVVVVVIPEVGGREQKSLMAKAAALKEAEQTITRIN